MFDFHQEIKHSKEALMGTINSTNLNLNHPKSILSSLQSSKGLPFSEILSKQVINEVIVVLEYRVRTYAPDITLWALLSQTIDADQSLQAAVDRVIAFNTSKNLPVPSSNTSAYSQARTRLPEDILSNLTRTSAEQLEQAAPSEWKWRNRTVQLVDGSSVSMEDTPENQNIYPQIRGQKPGLGFPIANIVAIISLATGMIKNVSIGPYSGKETGEHALLRQIFQTLKAGDIVVADRYYCSFFLVVTLIQMGIDVVFPQHGTRRTDFRKGKSLGKRDHIVQWKKSKKPEWMDQETYDGFPEEIEMREVLIENSQKGFRTTKRIMVTTFLNSRSVTKEDLSELYGYRWLVELDLRTIKDTMNMGVLRGKTPEMVRKEIWARLLAYNLIRKIMAQAAVVYEKKPRELSFKNALQSVRSFRDKGLLNEKNKEHYFQLLKAVASKRIGNRPGRQEPRRVKRRPKPTPLLTKPRHFYHKKAA